MIRTKLPLKESKDGAIRTWLDHQLATARSLRPEMSDMYLHKEDPYSVEIQHGNKNISHAFKSVVVDDIQLVWDWARENPRLAMSPVKVVNNQKKLSKTRFGLL